MLYYNDATSGLTSREECSLFTISDSHNDKSSTNHLSLSLAPEENVELLMTSPISSRQKLKLLMVHMQQNFTTLICAKKTWERLKPDLFIYIFIHSIWLSGVWSAWTSKPHIKTAFHLNKHGQQTEREKKGYCKSGRIKNKTILQRHRGDEKTDINDILYLPYLERDSDLEKTSAKMTKTYMISQCL